MKYKENFCVGCETCTNCGRNKDITLYECDECSNVSSEKDFLTNINGRDLCPICLKQYEHRLSINEISKYFEEYPIHVILPNGYDFPIQENNYSIDDCNRLFKKGAIFYYE